MPLSLVVHLILFPERFRDWGDPLAGRMTQCWGKVSQPSPEVHVHVVGKWPWLGFAVKPLLRPLQRNAGLKSDHIQELLWQPVVGAVLMEKGEHAVSITPLLKKGCYSGERVS